MKNIVVVGMGYAGIPIASVFADIDGFKVVGIQRRSMRSGWKIDCLNQAKNPIGGDEPGLSELIARVVNKGTFWVTDDYFTCKYADAILIDVQTPINVNCAPQLDSLIHACQNIAQNMKRNTLIVVESTVAPGTTINIIKPILETESNFCAGKDFSLVYSYERLMPGRLIYNITHYPRIIGGIDKKSTEKAIKLYKKVVKSKLYSTDVLTAEVAKVVENSYRDVNISFANEIAIICESLGVNYFKVRDLVNTLPDDPSNPSSNPVRNMLFAGAGVGGHCLPKDSLLLKYGVNSYGKFKVSPDLIITARSINNQMPMHMATLIDEALKIAKQPIKGAKIALLGIAYLENSDDTRNTPTKPLYEILKIRGANVVLYDPYVREFEISFSKNINEVTHMADALVFMTKHNVYESIDLDAIKRRMRTLIIVDGRNILSQDICERKGFIYRGVGKPR